MKESDDLIIFVFFFFGILLTAVGIYIFKKLVLIEKAKNDNSRNTEKKP